VALTAIFPARALYRAERQRHAVEYVSSLGGSVKYQHQMIEDKGYVPDAAPPAPAWLISVFGVDLFAEIHDVDLCVLRARDQFADDDMRRLHDVSAAKVLAIGYSHSVTDAGLSPIRRFSNLEILTLDELTNTTDGCLVHFRPLRKLQSFSATRLPWTGQGFLNLKHLPLESVTFTGCALKDESLAHLGAISTLRVLVLENTPITDQGLVHLSRLSNLEELHLQRTQISDAGVKHLFGLKKLRNLHIFQTNLTAAIAASLAEALPNCHISAPFGAYWGKSRGWQMYRTRN
jgi:hypothetical protein